MRSLVGLLLLTGCFGGPEPEDAPRTTPDADATRVEEVTLESAPARLKLSLPGEVEGYRDATLAAAAGGLVQGVLVEEGEVVRRGQALLRIDADLAAARVQQAEAQHEQAAAALVRVERMGDLAADSQHIDARSAEKSTAAALAQARAQLDRARITAPFDGVVAQVAVEVGEVASPGAPVARIVQLDKVLITLAVSDRDVVSLVPGTEVQVTASARSGTFPGIIRRVAPAADLRTRAFPVEVEVDNPDQLLLPGMIARVTVERELESDVLVVPQDWIVTQRAEQGVFLNREGQASWQPVQLGPIIRHDVVVTEGLSPGDRIIITGHRDLADGDALLVSRSGTCCLEGRPLFGSQR